MHQKYLPAAAARRLDLVALADPAAEPCESAGFGALVDL